MNDAARFAIRARHSPGERCAICHGEVAVSAVACLACKTLTHDDCLLQHGRCPTLGCRGQRPDDRLSVAFELPDRHAPFRRALWWSLIWQTALLTLGVFPAIAWAADPVYTRDEELDLVWLWLVPLALLCAFGLYRLRRRHNQLRAVLAYDNPILLTAQRVDEGSERGLHLRPGRVTVLTRPVIVETPQEPWILDGPATRSLLVHGLDEDPRHLLLVECPKSYRVAATRRL